MEGEIPVQTEKVKRVDQEHPSDREVSGNEFDEDDIGKDESSGNDEHDKDDELK